MSDKEDSGADEGKPNGNSVTSVPCTCRYLQRAADDYVLPDWSPTMPTEPGSEASNEADRALVAYAKDNGLPLITNEGNTPDGIIDEKMRKHARDAGVAVFAPCEFYDGKMNETEEVDAFLGRFRHEAPRYLSARNERDEMWKVLQWIEGYYRMVLRGEVAGRDAPIRVSNVSGLR